MTASNLEHLVHTVAADPALQARFAAAESIDEVLAIAADLGYALDASDLSALGGDAELTDTDLAAVAGGVASGSEGPWTRPWTTQDFIG